MTQAEFDKLQPGDLISCLGIGAWQVIRRATWGAGWEIAKMEAGAGFASGAKSTAIEADSWTLQAKAPPVGQPYHEEYITVEVSPGKNGGAQYNQLSTFTTYAQALDSAKRCAQENRAGAGMGTGRTVKVARVIATVKPEVKTVTTIQATVQEHTPGGGK